MNADFSGLKIAIAEAHAKRRGRLCVLRADIHENRVGTGSEKNEKKMGDFFCLKRKKLKTKNITRKKIENKNRKGDKKN